LITWVGSLTCDALAIIGAEGLVEKSCSNANSTYGVGIIACTGIGLLGLGVFFFWGR
jgi:hypothetical protein